MKRIEFWIRVTLVNLAIVALLGLTLRSKMLFSIPFLDFKHVLHAHSHFAFGGWVTLALLVVMVFKLLPSDLHKKPIYQWTLAGILINSYGMLFGFIWQGYGFVSILFSTLFILVTYVFSVVFIKDLFKTALRKEVKILAASAVAYMAISSIGPFTLAYLLATQSQNIYLYKDAIYTYLHLQYSGFFTLAIFALMIHALAINGKYVRWFANLVNVSVLPTMFISYLWHYPGILVQSIAVIGSVLTAASLLCFLAMLKEQQSSFTNLKPITKLIAGFSMIAFAFKLFFQAITIFPSLGPLVFSNRPIIIGFLHLVLLGFVTMFLLGYFLEKELLPYKKGTAAVWVFSIGILVNELVLFAQGLGFIMMISSYLINWLLLGAALCLFSGAALLMYSSIRFPPSIEFRKYQHTNQIIFKQ